MVYVIIDLHKSIFFMHSLSIKISHEGIFLIKHSLKKTNLCHTHVCCVCGKRECLHCKRSPASITDQSDDN